MPRASAWPAIHYDVTGSGPAVALLHGVSSSGAMWHQFGYVEALSAQFMTITIDLPGWGGSRDATGPEAFGLGGGARALETVLDELAIERAAVFGYSMGGMTALRFAAGAPERVWALVIGAANTGPRSANRAASGRRRALLARIGPGLKRRGASYLERLRGRRTPAVRPRRRRDHGISREEAHRRYLEDHAVLEEVPRLVTAPTLFVQGERDHHFAVEVTRALAASMPDAALVAVPGRGHELNHYPQTVLPIVTPFLMRHRPQVDDGATSEAGAPRSF